MWYLNNICTLVSHTDHILISYFSFYNTVFLYILRVELEVPLLIQNFLQMTKSKFSRLLAVILDDKIYENES